MLPVQVEMRDGANARTEADSLWGMTDRKATAKTRATRKATAKTKKGNCKDKERQLQRQEQPQVLRLRLAQRTRQTPLRMTALVGISTDLVGISTGLVGMSTEPSYLIYAFATSLE
jgi:hypothetical protein